MMTWEESDEGSVFDVVRDEDEDEGNLLTAFRHIPSESRDILQRTISSLSKKKSCPQVALNSYPSFRCHK